MPKTQSLSAALVFALVNVSVVVGGAFTSSMAIASDDAPSESTLPKGHPKVPSNPAAKSSAQSSGQASTKSKLSLLPESHHAGVLREGPHMNLEMVKQTGQIYLYAQSKTGESVPSQKLEMTATYRPLAAEPPIPAPIKDYQKIPPTPAATPVNPHATPFPETKIILQPDTDHFMAMIDLRVPYVLKVEAKPIGKKTKPDVFEFTVQP